MKKTIFIFTFALSSLFAATNSQVLQYLSFSHSEEEVLSIERVFDTMRQRQENNESNESTSQTSVVYQEYLEQHLSSNELEAILKLYHQPIMERYVSEVKGFVVNQDDMDAFLAHLQEEPLSSERETIVDSIVDILVNEKLQLNFYRSMMQRYQKSDKKRDAKPSKREQKYIDGMKKAQKRELLYGSQVFSMEEMKELHQLMSSSIFKKVKKVENEALVTIMNSYIKTIKSKPKELKK